MGDVAHSGYEARYDRAMESRFESMTALLRIRLLQYKTDTKLPRQLRVTPVRFHGTGGYRRI